MSSNTSSSATAATTVAAPTTSTTTSTTIPHLTVSPAETTLEATPHPTSSVRPSQSPTPSSSASPEPSNFTSSATEKKPLKKRKSWGQELPIPKTNLPPRKRAKTEDEKEQRRIERVLRNRAAAQTSRERKRLEVEKLETEKKQVETENGLLLQRLAAMEAENRRLAEQIAQLQQSGPSVAPSVASSPSPFTNGTTTTPASTITSPSNATSPVVARVRGTREESPTLSPTLFKQEYREKSSFDRLPVFPRYNPNAVDDDAKLSNASAAAAATSSSTAFNETSDMTQHPAAMLCDLQCQSAPSKNPAEEETATATAEISPSTAAAATTTTTAVISNTPEATATTAPISSPLQAYPSSEDLDQDQFLQPTILKTIILVHFHLCQAMASMTCSSAILNPLRTILRSLKEGCPLPISTEEQDQEQSDHPQQHQQPPSPVQQREHARQRQRGIHQRLSLILWLISTPNLPSHLLQTLLPTSTTPTTTISTTAPTTATTTTNKSKSKTTSTTSPISSPTSPTTPQTTSQTTTATSTSPLMSPSQQRPVFRMRLLTRLLACSPALARPLRDATGRALQQVLRRREGSAARGNAAAGTDFTKSGCSLLLLDVDVPGVSKAASVSEKGDVDDEDRLSSMLSELYSWEFLMTVMWAVDCIQRKQQRRRMLRKKRTGGQMKSSSPSPSASNKRKCRRSHWSGSCTRSRTHSPQSYRSRRTA